MKYKLDKCKIDFSRFTWARRHAAAEVESFYRPDRDALRDEQIVA